TNQNGVHGRATATIFSVRTDTSFAFPICSASAAWRTCETMPEYSTSRLCSSTPSGGRTSCVSMGIPSNPITLAAKEPSTLPQICSRSSLNAILAPPPSSPLLHPRQQIPQRGDLPLGRRQLQQAPPRRFVARVREPPVDFAGLSDQSLPHVQLGEREGHRRGSVPRPAPPSS